MIRFQVSVAIRAVEKKVGQRLRQLPTRVRPGESDNAPQLYQLSLDLTLDLLERLECVREWSMLLAEENGDQ